MKKYNLVIAVVSFLVILSNSSQAKQMSSSHVAQSTDEKVRVITLGKENLDLLWKSQEKSVVIQLDGMKAGCEQNSPISSKTKVILNNRSVYKAQSLLSEESKSWSCYPAQSNLDFKNNQFSLHLDRIDDKRVISGFMVKEGFFYYIPFTNFDTSNVLEVKATTNIPPIDCAEMDQKETEEPERNYKQSSESGFVPIDPLVGMIEDIENLNGLDLRARQQLRQLNIAVETTDDFLGNHQRRGDQSPQEAMTRATLILRNYFAAAAISLVDNFGLTPHLQVIYLYENNPFVYEDKYERLDDVVAYWNGGGWRTEDFLDRRNDFRISEPRQTRVSGGVEKIYMEDMREGAGEKSAQFNEGLSFVYVVAGTQPQLFDDGNGGGLAKRGGTRNGFRSNLGHYQYAYATSNISTRIEDNLVHHIGHRDDNLVSGVDASPNETGQIQTLIHEVGHVLGSNHLRCYRLNDEIVDRCGRPNDRGGCYFENEEDYDRNPLAEGTVMTYCPARSNNAHPLVQAGVLEATNNLFPDVLDSNVPLVENSIPVIHGIDFPEVVPDNGQVRIEIDATDADGDLLYYSIGHLDRFRNKTTLDSSISLDFSNQPQGIVEFEIYVADSRGASDSRRIQIRQENNQLPNLVSVRVNPRREVVAGDLFTVELSASDIERDEVIFEVDFGDGTIKTSQLVSFPDDEDEDASYSFEHRYFSPANQVYPIRIKIKNSDGEFDDIFGVSNSNEITILNAAPVIGKIKVKEQELENNRFIEQNNLRIYRISSIVTDANRDELSYRWEFSDGTSIDSLVPFVMKQIEGPFEMNVTLIVTDSNGETSRRSLQSAKPNNFFDRNINDFRIPRF